jgi:tetratricopeptide (TPR) repeat protein
MPVPASDVGGPSAPLAVPPVPSFALPAGDPGVRTPRELRARGQYDWLGTEITVRGYVTWKYDCVKHVARPGEAPAQTQKRIDGDPTQCERPKLYLGEAKDTPIDRSIWVVDVPRPPMKLERQRLPAAELASWPAVPKVAPGDYVAITGTWALQSPHNEGNSDGLLVFKALQPAQPAAAGSAAAPVATAPTPQPPAAAAPPKIPAAPAPVPIDPEKRAESLRLANAGVLSYGVGDFAAAIRDLSAAVATWPDNHFAWYSLAAAHVSSQDWVAAAAAAERATALVPGNAMYRTMRGVALYEAALRRAREALAAAQGRRPEDVLPDLRSVNQDAALAELALATHINDAVWRAHYYRGRILRDRGDAALAAEAFSQAVRRGPAQAAPYVALAELYRRWGYLDQAIEIARLAIATLPADEQGDAYHALGAAQDDRREDAGAVDSYTKALERKPPLYAALFSLAQVQLRMKQPAAARTDLQKVIGHREVDPVTKAMAQQLLAELGRKKP